MSSTSEEETGVEHTLEEVLQVMPKSVIDSLSPISGCQWILSKEGPNQYRVSFRTWQGNSWVEVTSHDVSTVISVTEIYDQFPVHRARTLNAAQMQEVLPQIQHLVYQPVVTGQSPNHQHRNTATVQGVIVQHDGSSQTAGNITISASQLSRPDEDQEIMTSNLNPYQYYQENSQGSQISGQPAYVPLGTMTSALEENISTFHSQPGFASSHVLGDQHQSHGPGFQPQSTPNDIVRGNIAQHHVHQGLNRAQSMVHDPSLGAMAFTAETWDQSMSPSLSEHDATGFGSSHAPNMESNHQSAFQDLGFMQECMVGNDLLNLTESQSTRISNVNLPVSITGSPSFADEDTLFYISNHGAATSAEGDELSQQTSTSSPMDLGTAGPFQPDNHAQFRKGR